MSACRGFSDSEEAQEKVNTRQGKEKEEEKEEEEQRGRKEGRREVTGAREMWPRTRRATRLSAGLSRNLGRKRERFFEVVSSLRLCV
jgi:hypothetical protein